MIERLGIMGGMFDPVHNGHIAAARHALTTLRLDELRMIPCATPNHRERARASAAHRLNMLELATEDDDAITVDAIEVQRPGISYSVDTLTALRASRIADHLVFVLGIDSFNTLTRWHDWQRLPELCHFFVLGREGAEIEEPVAEAIGLEERQVGDPEALFTPAGGLIYVTTDFRQVESSSAVRRLIRDNEDASELINPKVHLYIEDNRLYR